MSLGKAFSFKILSFLGLWGLWLVAVLPATAAQPILVPSTALNCALLLENLPQTKQVDQLIVLLEQIINDPNSSPQGLAAAAQVLQNQTISTQFSTNYILSSLKKLLAVETLTDATLEKSLEILAAIIKIEPNQKLESNYSIFEAILRHKNFSAPSVFKALAIINDLSQQKENQFRAPTLKSMLDLTIDHLNSINDLASKQNAGEQILNIGFKLMPFDGEEILLKKLIDTHSLSHEVLAKILVYIARGFDSSNIILINLFENLLQSPQIVKIVSLATTNTSAEIFNKIFDYVLNNHSENQTMLSAFTGANLNLTIIAKFLALNNLSEANLDNLAYNLSRYNKDSDQTTYTELLKNLVAKQDVHFFKKHINLYKTLPQLIIVSNHPQLNSNLLYVMAHQLRSLINENPSLELSKTISFILSLLNNSEIDQVTALELLDCVIAINKTNPNSNQILGLVLIEFYKIGSDSTSIINKLIEFSGQKIPFNKDGSLYSLMLANPKLSEVQLESIVKTFLTKQAQITQSDNLILALLNHQRITKDLIKDLVNHTLTKSIDSNTPQIILAALKNKKTYDATVRNIADFATGKLEPTEPLLTEIFQELEKRIPGIVKEKLGIKTLF